MQGRPRPFEGTGDKRVFDREDYSRNIDPFEVPQKLSRRTLRMSSSRDEDDNHGVKMPSVIQPHENDVLLGRGGKNNRHSGNEKLRLMARQYREDYQIATKKGKSQLSRKLVQQMRELSPPGRFLKRDSTTKTWEDVGDDAAREKGSQVLRDAVAGPTESNDDGRDEGLDEGCDNEHRRATSDPLSADRRAVIQSAYAYTPSLHSTTSESFPPPTPVTTSRKRHRYVVEQNLSPEPVGDRYVVEQNLAPEPVGDYRPYSVSYGRHPGYTSRQRLEHYPGDYGYSHPRPSPVASAAPPLPSSQGVAQVNVNSEFDLFNCELLESDHEDQADLLPTESHEDTF